MSKSANRSFERITDIDLRRLSALAAADFDDLFRRNARWRPYRRRLLLLCLCQGAALHYASPRRGTAADRIGGVNDFDVWGFFADWPNGRPFPPRRHGFQDFGPSKFGRSPKDKPRFRGRRVDVLGRSIQKRPRESPIAALRRYLETRRTESAHLERREEMTNCSTMPSRLCVIPSWAATKLRAARDRQTATDCGRWRDRHSGRRRSLPDCGRSRIIGSRNPSPEPPAVKDQANIATATLTTVLEHCGTRRHLHLVF